MIRSMVLALALVVGAAGCDDVPPAGSYAVVFGRVYDVRTSQPLAGAVVTVDSVDVATTGDDGTYRIGTIPPGPTDVAVALPPGYAVADPSTLTFSVRAGDAYVLDVPAVGG